MLYCIVLSCIVLYCIVLYCILLYCIVLCCAALCCASTTLNCTATALHCIALHCIALYCIVLSCAVLCYAVLRLHCAALHCIALHCISRNGDPGSDIVFRKLVNQREQQSKCFVLFINVIDFIHSLVLRAFPFIKGKEALGTRLAVFMYTLGERKLVPFWRFNYIEGLHQSTLAAKTRTVIKLARPSP